MALPEAAEKHEECPPVTVGLDEPLHNLTRDISKLNPSHDESADDHGRTVCPILATSVCQFGDIHLSPNFYVFSSTCMRCICPSSGYNSQLQYLIPLTKHCDEYCHMPKVDFSLYKLQF